MACRSPRLGAAFAAGCLARERRDRLPLSDPAIADVEHARRHARNRWVVGDDDAGLADDELADAWPEIADAVSQPWSNSELELAWEPLVPAIPMLARRASRFS